MMFLRGWKYFIEEFTACGAASGTLSFKLKSIETSHFDGKTVVLHFFCKIILRKMEKVFFCFSKLCAYYLWQYFVFVWFDCFFWVVSQFVPVCVKFSSSDSLKETLPKNWKR